MNIPNTLLNILHFILVAITLLSGTVKIIGVRMDFMRITQVALDNWKITIFGIVQVLVALLFAFKKTMTVGAVAYSLIYAFVSWYYFSYDLQPKIAPVLLTILPIAFIISKKTPMKIDNNERQKSNQKDK